MALFSTNHTLTQGSLHYRLATLGYQKRNPYGVRLSHELPLRPLFLLKWLSKAEPLWGSSILQISFAPALPFDMAIKSGRRWGSSICKKTLPMRSPLLGEGVGVRL